MEPNRADACSLSAEARIETLQMWSKVGNDDDDW